MEPGLVLQIILVVIGAFLMVETIVSLAKRRITEPFSLTWGLIALVIILAGILLRPAGWNLYLSNMGLFLAILIVVCVIYGAFFVSGIVSTLMRKVNELAITVSLQNADIDRLTDENARMQEQIAALQSERATEESEQGKANG